MNDSIPELLAAFEVFDGTYKRDEVVVALALQQEIVTARAETAQLRIEASQARSEVAKQREAARQARQQAQQALARVKRERTEEAKAARRRAAERAKAWSPARKTTTAHPVKSPRAEKPVVVDPTSWRPVFHRSKGKEKVVIPLGGTSRYRLEGTWDRTEVLFTRSSRVRGATLTTNGEVVSLVSTIPLSYGNVRVVVELSRPARPLEKLVRKGDRTYLILTYLR